MTKIIRKINITQRHIVNTLSVFVIMFMFSYLFFVNNTSFTAAEYERITESFVKTQSQIGELELAYLQKNSNIEKGMQNEFGLVAIADENIDFVRRNNINKLTFND